MHDPGQKLFSEGLLNRSGRNVPGDDLDTERQPGVQAFTLRVKYRTGRRIEAFAWSHYVGYEWLGMPDGKEQLTLLFGARALVIEGHRLNNLFREINDGRRRTIREMTEPEALLALHEGEKGEAVITGITAYPRFEDIVREIRGEDEHESGFAGKVRGR